MMAGHHIGLMPRKTPRRPATASARVEECVLSSSNNEMKSIRPSSNCGHMASTSIGKEQLYDHMIKMGIPFTSSQESIHQTTKSNRSIKMNKQDSFGPHRRSVSFLELVDRNSRGPSDSFDSTLEEVQKTVSTETSPEHDSEAAAAAAATASISSTESEEAAVDPSTHSVLSQVSYTLSFTRQIY